jgi:hypothetical protein
MSNPGRYGSGRSSRRIQRSVGPASLQTPPKHRRRLVVAGNPHTQLEALPAGVPMGAQLAWQPARLCLIDCVYGLGRFDNLGCPNASCRWAWPIPHGRAPRYVRVAGLSYLPGISAEAITSPRSFSGSSTRDHDVNAEESRA